MIVDLKSVAETASRHQNCMLLSVSIEKIKFLNCKIAQTQTASFVNVKTWTIYCITNNFCSLDNLFFNTVAFLEFIFLQLPVRKC